MLPDFPELKNKVSRYIQISAKKAAYKQRPLLNQTPVKKIFEGNEATLIREDGSTENIEMKKFSKSESYSNSDLQNLTLVEYHKRLKNLFLDMSMEQAENTIEVISQAAEKVGNTIKTKDGLPSIEDFLDAIERVRLDFDQDGKAKFPTIFTGEAGFENFSEIFQELENEPHKSRFNDIITQKKLEYRARESNRKLVD